MATLSNLKNSKKTTGLLGERLAAKFFLEKGYQFLEKNYHEIYGEIDLIFKKNEELVFVEVKTRTWNSHGEGFESVDEKKLEKLSKTAELFCQKNWFEFENARFDVVSIQLSKDKKTAKIKHLDKIL